MMPGILRRLAMKLPRVRFTVRRLVVVVALAATVMGSVTYLKRRSAQLRAIYLKQALNRDTPQRLECSPVSAEYVGAHRQIHMG
jgi:hypothetical protein